MASRWATKSPHEREEEEAERLVRPSPKVRPPRHDRRRETFEPEEDSDDTGDQDLSRNYKNIGGSLAQRIAEKWVRVRNRDKDVITRVTPETLKEEPDLYEKVPENEPHQDRGVRKPRSPEKPAKPHYHKEHLPHPEWPDRRPLPPKPLQPPKRVKPVKRVPVPRPPEPENEPKPKPPGWVWERRQAIVERFLTARGKTPEAAQTPPRMVTVRKKDTGWVGPVSEETLRQDPSAYEKVDETEASPKPAPRPKKPKPAEFQPEVMDPRAKKPKVKKPKAEPRAEESKEESKEETEGKRAPKEPGKSEGKSQKSKDPWSDAEVLYRLSAIMGPDEAYKALKSGVTPESLGEFSRAYTSAKGSRIKGDIGKHLERIKWFSENAGHPKSGRSRDGMTLPWDALDAEEQAENQAKTQARLTGLRFALGSQVNNTLKDRGVPESYGKALVEFVLGGHQDVDRASYAAFQGRLASGKIEPVSSGKVVDLLKSLEDRGEQKVVAAQYQADLFKEVEKEVLNHPDHQLSEHATPREIVATLQMAEDYVRERDVPKELSAVDLRHIMRDRVLRKLRSLPNQEEKARKVQAAFDKEDAREYEADLREWNKLEKAYWREQKKRNTARDRVQRDVAKKAAERGVLPEQVDGEVVRELRKQGLHPDDDPKPPDKPLAPPSYQTRRPRREQEKESAQVLQELATSLGASTKTASSVAARWGAYSSCRPIGVMAQTSRTTVYWGVTPPEGKPYADWAQAQDLTEADHTVILREAKNWLGFYSEAIPDIRCRAALDLAIRTAEGGRYSARVPATEYDQLLAKLLKVPAEEPLLTKQGTEGSPYRPGIGETPVGERNTMDHKQADITLARLDRLATVIQAKHEQWGMPFPEAKAIVNAIDRTADEIEVAAYGPESLLRRQIEVVTKNAKVIQQDGDEPYMATFNAPMAPHQADADEPYMKLYSDDQTTAVNDGKSTVGRPLAP